MKRIAQAKRMKAIGKEIKSDPDKWAIGKKKAYEKPQVVYINQRLVWHQIGRELTRLANVLTFRQSLKALYRQKKSLKFKRKEFLKPDYQQKYFTLFLERLPVDDFLQISGWAFTDNLEAIKKFRLELGAEYDRMNAEIDKETQKYA